jgi:mRNA interferase MazF
MSKPKPAEVWLVRFPFTELASTKVRPALVLAAHGEDLIVMGIFSKVPAGILHNTWLLIKEDDPVFQQSGLKKTSVFRAEKIAVVHESVFQRSWEAYRQILYCRHKQS